MLVWSKNLLIRTFHLLSRFLIYCPRLCVKSVQSSKTRVVYQLHPPVFWAFISILGSDLLISCHVDSLIQSEGSWVGQRQEMRYLTTHLNVCTSSLFLVLFLLSPPTLTAQFFKINCIVAARLSQCCHWSLSALGCSAGNSLPVKVLN